MASLCFLTPVLMVLLVGVVTPQEEEQRPLSMRCVSEGRFPHPSDCGGFVDCLPDGEGLRAREGSCRGRAYHPTLRKCVTLNKVDGCKPRAARALANDPKLDYVCENSTSDFMCADCKTLVLCVNGTAYPETCGSGDLCNIDNDHFGGGVCYPNQPSDCSCDAPNQFKEDSYNEARFLFCEATGSDPQIFQCPDDHVFDSTMNQCIHYNGLPECTSIGVFANSRNCSQFYNCIPTIDGWVQKPFSCNNETHKHLMYNEAAGSCEDPCTWGNGNFKCEEEGRFADPLNCQRYYECVKDTSEASDFRQALHECPEGYEWDQSARNSYGHCVLEGNSLNPCVPAVANKCSVDRSQCPSTTEEPDDTTDQPTTRQHE
ncbi:uncharacterized protein [Cherax quadricarinatus]|uniref:Obstructor J1 n=2 Tax=Cherax quadricarinatus TaxID=27406 RepID=A0A2L1GH32_CHEQU|nr:obstructor J1 [Cherax quadricarinatus]